MMMRGDDGIEHHGLDGTVSVHSIGVSCSTCREHEIAAAIARRRGGIVQHYASDGRIRSEHHISVACPICVADSPARDRRREKPTPAANIGVGTDPRSDVAPPPPTPDSVKVVLREGNTPEGDRRWLARFLVAVALLGAIAALLGAIAALILGARI